MEQKESVRNMFVSVIVLFVCAFLWFKVIPSQIRINALWGGSSGVNGRTFPYFSVAVMALASLGEFVTSLIKYISIKQSEDNKDKVKIKWNQEIRAGLILILIIAYGIIFSKFGYITASLIIPPIMLFVLGSKNWKEYISVYLVAAVMYIVFLYILKIHLP